MRIHQKLFLIFPCLIAEISGERYLPYIWLQPFIHSFHSYTMNASLRKAPTKHFYVLLHFPLITLTRGSYYPHYLRMKVKLSKIRTFPKLILNIYLLIRSSSHFRVAFCLLLGICREQLRLTQRVRLIRVLSEHGCTHNYI